MPNSCLFKKYCWRYFFLLPNSLFLFLSNCMCLPALKRQENLTKQRKKTRRNCQRKTRAQNVETETAKKTGHGENLDNGRELLLFRISTTSGCSRARNIAEHCGLWAASRATWKTSNLRRTRAARKTYLLLHRTRSSALKAVQIILVS